MVDLDADTRRRIQELLREMRGWHPGVPERTLKDLVWLFELDELVIVRLADSEGFDLRVSNGIPTEIDPAVGTTRPISLRDEK